MKNSSWKKRPSKTAALEKLVLKKLLLAVKKYFIIKRDHQKSASAAKSPAQLKNLSRKKQAAKSVLRQKSPRSRSFSLKSIEIAKSAFMRMKKRPRSLYKKRRGKMVAAPEKRRACKKRHGQKSSSRSRPKIDGCEKHGATKTLSSASRNAA